MNDRKWRSMNAIQRHLQSLIFKRFEEVKLQMISDHWYKLSTQQFLKDPFCAWRFSR